MGSEKRARQKENRRARQEAEQREARRVKWRRRVVMWSAIAVLVIAVFVIGNLITAGDDPAPQPPVVVTDTTTADSPRVIVPTDTTAPEDS